MASSMSPCRSLPPWRHKLRLRGWVNYLTCGQGPWAQEDSVTVTLFLGTAAAAAILAGFAGVAVVFGLTADGDRVSVFRLEAGKSLRGTWTSTSLAGFAAAGLSLGAAITVVNGRMSLPPGFSNSHSFLGPTGP